MSESTVQNARESPARRNGHISPTSDEARIEELKTRLANRLNRLSLELMSQLAERVLPGGGVSEGASRRGEENPLQARVKLLGQLAAGLAIAPAETLPRNGAGYGSTVIVEDEAGDRSKYVLMIGALVDIEAGHVSLASPIGKALLGREPADVITVELPLRERRLRIIDVVTLDSMLTTLEMLQE